MYEVFEHTADLGLRVRAADLPTLFAEAGQGLYSLIVDLSCVEPKQETSIRIEAREHD
jgi:SHS2 domain-containing protein